MINKELLMKSLICVREYDDTTTSTKKLHKIVWFHFSLEMHGCFELLAYDSSRDTHDDYVHMDESTC
jgi:hypothetical protein